MPIQSQDELGGTEQEIYILFTISPVGRKYRCLLPPTSKETTSLLHDELPEGEFCWKSHGRYEYF